MPAVRLVGADAVDGPRTGAVCDDLAVKPGLRSIPMHQDINVVGLDLAKRVFQVHAIGIDGKLSPSVS